ncbi:MAG TPA: hypothetical protein VFR34_07430 [Paracoccaceae bacterium]|nr:hypothetical protein [Paracoccaceae bacterium]
MDFRSACRILALAPLALAPPVAAQESAKDYAEEVQAVVEQELQAWIADPVIIYAIREANETNAALTAEDVARLDAQWIAEEGEGDMIGDLLDRQASVLMRDRRKLSQGIITEIILMDAYGLNVAISDPTTDYFQGDEAKWQETYLKGPGAIFVDDIKFDESTGLVQTQVSMSVTDPETGEAIGAVTFGINLEVLRN